MLTCSQGQFKMFLLLFFEKVDTHSRYLQYEGEKITLFLWNFSVYVLYQLFLQIVSIIGQTFNVAIDSGYNLLGKPCNFVLDKCPEKAADGKTRTSCKRHKMEIFTKK